MSALWVSRALEFLQFEYAFVQYSALSAVVVGVMCGISGVWMVLRGLSLVGDATAHATLPGLCLAFLLTGSSHSAVLMGGALASGLCAMAVLQLALRPCTQGGPIGVPWEPWLGRQLVAKVAQRGLFFS